MTLLPQDLDNDTYQVEIHAQPLAFWQGALAVIAQRHDLGSDEWARATLGRNVVLLDRRFVVKLSPPCWPGEIEREVVALKAVATSLPVATPTVVATGTISGWEYMIQERMPGTNLWALWGQLDPAARADLAYQHGEVMAAVHAIPLGTIPGDLSFDWMGMLDYQRNACADAMRGNGVNADLVAQVETYVAEAGQRLAAETDFVLLHGDLTHLNFLVEQRADRWQITSLIDWGDIKIGPRMHEFISPGVHMYRGDQAAMEQWYRGYGWHGQRRTAEREHEVMARAMLYYSGEFAQYIDTVPGAATCRDWASMAGHFWRFIAE